MKQYRACKELKATLAGNTRKQISRDAIKSNRLTPNQTNALVNDVQPHGCTKYETCAILHRFHI